jgi:hypothetical protein
MSAAGISNSYAKLCCRCANMTTVAAADTYKECCVAKDCTRTVCTYRRLLCVTTTRVGSRYSASTSTVSVAVAIAAVASTAKLYSAGCISVPCASNIRLFVQIMTAQCCTISFVKMQQPLPVRLLWLIACNCCVSAVDATRTNASALSRTILCTLPLYHELVYLLLHARH